MSNLPPDFQAPRGYVPPPKDYQSELTLSAVLLTVAAAMRLCITLIELALNGMMVIASNAKLAEVQGDELAAARMMVGFTIAMLALSVIGLVLIGLTLHGAARMVWMHNRTWAMVGAICAMLPTQLHPCCCMFSWPLSIAAGVFALIVLNKPEVREIFDTITVAQDPYAGQNPGRF